MTELSGSVTSYLNDQVVERFQRDGSVCLRGLFRPSLLKLVAAGIEKNLAQPSPFGEFLRAPQGSGRFFNDYCSWQRIEEFRRYVYESPAAQIAGLLMKSSRAIFYHDHVLVKEPGAEKESPWHHDQPYYPVDGWQMCSIWMPLDPVLEETSLRFVKGSHAWNRWFVPRKFATEGNYERVEGRPAPRLFEDVPDIKGRPEDFEILSWALDPGDCVVFHGLTLHGAAGNLSKSTSRRVLSTRWVGDDALFAERPWEVSPPITGGLQPGDAMACDTFPVVWSR